MSAEGIEVDDVSRVTAFKLGFDVEATPFHRAGDASLEEPARAVADEVAAVPDSFGRRASTLGAVAIDVRPRVQPACDSTQSPPARACDNRQRTPYLRQRAVAELDDAALLAAAIGRSGRATPMAGRSWPDLAALLSLDEAGLAHVLGLRARQARRAAAVLELNRRLLRAARPERPLLADPEAIAALIAPLARIDHERLWALPLDPHHRLIGEPIEVSRGDVDGTDAGPRAFFRAAPRVGATTAVAVHNHPSGDPAPSGSDLAVTRRLAAAGRAVDVLLVDHVVVALGGEWRSIRRDSPECFR